MKEELAILRLCTEDDMTLPKKIKKELLQYFYQYIKKPGWNFTQSKSNKDGYHYG
jgi:hypothetical protein